MDWHFLDLSDVQRSDLMPSPRTGRVLVSSSATQKYMRCGPLARVHSQANLIYDAETDTLTRVTSKVRPCSRPWSPGGRRVLMQGADRRFGYVYDAGANGLQPRRRIPHWSHTLGWLTDRELVFWTWSGNSAGRHRCGAVDVVTGAERTIGRVRRPHRFLGTQGDTKLVFCYFSWDARTRRRDATVRILRMGEGFGQDIALPLGAEPHQLSTDGRYLLLSAALPKSGTVHLSLFDLEAKRAQPLQSTAEDRARAVGRSGRYDWALSLDGRWLAARWSVVRGKRRRASVEVLDLASRSGRVLCEQKEYGSVTFGPNSRRLAAWDREGQVIEVFSVPSGDDAERWVVPVSVPDHWLKLAWAGSDRLLLALPVRRAPWFARLIRRSFPRLVRCSSDTLWIADLKTKQVRMIWPQKWVHPTWRVLTHEEWKEERG